MNSAWWWGSPAGGSRPRTSSCFATTTFHRCWWKPPSSRTPTTSCGCATRRSASMWRRPCTMASSASLLFTPCPSLRRFGTAFDLTASVISHLHPDPFTDIYSLRNELAYGRLPDPPAPPMLLFAPAGAAGYLAACLPKPESRQEFAAGFTFRALEDGVGNAGEVRLRFVMTSHPMPCHAVEVRAGGRRLVYSADTGPCQALEHLAAGCV